MKSLTKEREDLFLVVFTFVFCTILTLFEAFSCFTLQCLPSPE